VFGVIGVLAFELALGSGGKATNHRVRLRNPKHATAGVLGWPGGPVLVTIVGLILIGVALYQGYQGVGRKFCDDARTDEMGAGVLRAYTALGVFRISRAHGGVPSGRLRRHQGRARL
jgi:Domain of Unknown Function (DUF1206)